MSERHSDNDGSDIFWPGYVDATTNLILNLLFLLTILIVAVFMFALELGRTSKLEAEIYLAPAVEQAETNIPDSKTDLGAENIALKREIKRLEDLLAQQQAKKKQAAPSAKVLNVKAKTVKPENGLDKFSASDFELKVNFKADAIAFTPAEQNQLLEALKPVVKNKKTAIYVEVPVGFSEAKRLGFYRAMAVRNLLIEMKLPKENIDVAIIEGAKDANASVVRVRSR